MSEHDVIIIGGGPAGSCAGNLLASAGLDVVVLEREYFPRFHIGESLLPMELASLARLGINLDDGPYLRKGGALMIDERSDRQARFAFGDGLPGTPTYAHQVERATFDQDLLAAAAKAGAAVHEGHEVLSVELGERGVAVEARASTRDGQAASETVRFRARYLVDATGQKAMLARNHKTVEPYRDFGRAAVFRTYTNMGSAAVAELHESGDIIIKIVDDGWMWGIPLVSGDFSVGLVKAKGKIDQPAFDAEMAASPLLSRLTVGAEPGLVRVIGNFSYRNTKPHGPRFACIGDAACFLDPIFSSGVVLALTSGEQLADLLIPALAESREHEAELMAPLADHMSRAYDVFSRFLQRFYHGSLTDNVLLVEHDSGQKFRSGVISVLAADVWRDDNEFQNMLMRARRR